MTYTPPFRRKFANTVEMGGVIARDMAGTDQIVVIEDPTRITNLVGERTSVHVRVALFKDTRVQGEMIYRPTDVVFVRVDTGSRNEESPA